MRKTASGTRRYEDDGKVPEHVEWSSEKTLCCKALHQPKSARLPLLFTLNHIEPVRVSEFWRKKLIEVSRQV